MVNRVIRNKHDHPVKVGHVTLNPHQQLAAPNDLSNEINDALDRGDIELIDATLTPAELKADADAIMKDAKEMKKTAES